MNSIQESNVALVPIHLLGSSCCCSSWFPNDFNIADPNFIDFHNIGAIDVPPFISRFSTPSTTSSIVHVITSFSPDIVWFSQVVTCVSSSDDEPHPHDFFFHCATNSAHHNGIVLGKLGFHSLNVYHALVGLFGAARFDSYFPVIEFTSLHPFESNVIV